MRVLVLAVSVFLLAGCARVSFHIPMDTVDKANELCASMDGVKNMSVITYRKTPKVNYNVLTTEIKVVCNRHSAEVSRTWDWEINY
jgi:uncharacterized lipoprotein YajG